MAKYKGAEKRKYRRIYKEIPLNIIQYNKKKTLPKLDQEVCVNISVGGTLIECSKKLAIKARLKLVVMFIFDSKFRVINTPAKIVWCKKSFRRTYYIGCKFTRLSRKDKAFLKKFTSLSSST